MKTKLHKLILILISTGPLAFTQSCAPNLARTNARIEKGFNVGAAATFNHTSKDSLNHESQDFTQLHFNIGGGTRNEQNVGFSVLGKMGWRAVPELDVYIELPSKHPFYYGLGAEVSEGSGGYLIGSYYFAKEVFVTFTGRLLLWKDQLLYNPQIAFGWSRESGSPTISIFTGYEHYTGDGLDMDMSFDGEHSTAGYVNRLIYGGLSIQF